jgi:membrane protease YdiL (CAAX protease family)
MEIKPQPVWRWLAVLLVGVLVWSIAKAIGTLAILAIVGSPEKVKGLWLAPWGMIFIPLATAGIAWTLRIADRGLRDLGLTARNGRKDALIGAAVAVLWVAVEFLVLVPLTGGSGRSDVIASRAATGDAPWGLVGGMISGWVVGGFGEELFFRGFIIYALRNLLGNKPWSAGVAALVSVIYFAIGHAYQGWIGMIDVGVSGLIFSLLYLGRGRLTASMVAHGVFDMLGIVGIYFLYR